MVQKLSVLLQPLVTEKTLLHKNKYYFLIHDLATKNDVIRAVKEFYGVDALEVNISRLPEKLRVMGKGRALKRRSDVKKAIVTLKKDQQIDFNSFK